MEGIHGIKPVINKVKFSRGVITLHLEDGRVITAPLSFFPSIKRMSEDKRKHVTIVNDQILLFKYCDEVYHIRDFLGYEQEYVAALLT